MGEETVIITGDRSQAALQQLQSSTSLNLSMDKNGLVSATGEAKTDADKQLQSAINDPSRVVNLNATSSNETPLVGTSGEIGNLVVGAYQGSHQEGDKIIGNQTVNPDQTKAIENNGGTKAGTAVLHEVLESYNAMNIGTGIHPSADGETYTQAHNKTNSLPQANTDEILNDVGVDKMNALPGYNLYYHQNPQTGGIIILFKVSQETKPYYR
jgi:hypothetical protein